MRVAVAVRKARLDGMPVACALVWADGASDRIDAIAASIIRTSTRSEAIRTGSADEVAIVAHEHDAARLADILSAAVADVGLGFGIALKAGVAAAPEHASDGPALLAAARRALTAAISRGPVATAR